MSRRAADIHALAASYALDALDDRERALFERHLEGCEGCGGEVSGFLATTARMAGAVAEAPPSHLRAETLELVSNTRQVSPLARSRRHLPMLAAAAAAVVLIAGATVGAVLGTSGLGSPHTAASSDVARVLAAPDARMMNLHLQGGAMVKVVMSSKEGRLVFLATGLRAVSGAQCYELWLVGSGGDRTAGVLPRSSEGMTGPVVVSGLHPGDRLALSVEPASGSPQPTSKMLFVMPL